MLRAMSHVQSSSDGKSPASSRTASWRTVAALLPYLWPRGANELKLRVVIAMVLLVLAKLANVVVPVFYKQAVDGPIDETFVDDRPFMKSLDLASYEKYLSGDMVDYDLPDEAIAEAMRTVPVIG